MSWLSTIRKSFESAPSERDSPIEMRVIEDDHPVSPVQFNNRHAKKLLPTHGLIDAINSLDWETDDQARHAMLAGICDFFGTSQSIDDELALVADFAQKCVCNNFKLPAGETAELWFSRQFNGEDPIDRMIAIIKLYGTFPSLVPPSDLIFVNSNFCHCWHSLEDILAENPDYRDIDLRAQKLYLLPTNILQFKNLRSLNAPSNCLIQLPYGLWELQHLETLSVPNNWLDEVPSHIARFSHLKTLNISDNLMARQDVQRLRNELLGTKCGLIF